MTKMITEVSMYGYRGAMPAWLDILSCSKLPE